MTNPTGWETNKIDWLPDEDEGVLNTDLNRIENNQRILKNYLLSDYGTFQATVPTPYFTGAVTVTLRYVVVNDVVTIAIPSGWESPATTSDTDLQIVKVAAAWPTAIVPKYDHHVPCIFKINTDAAYNLRPGIMIIPADGVSNIVCYITRRGGTLDDGYFVEDFFYESGGGVLKKAIPAQSLTYMVEDAPASTTTTPAP